MGTPEFMVMPYIDPLTIRPDAPPTIAGIVIVEKGDFETAFSPVPNVMALNKLFKISKDGQLVPVLFKKLEMAEEVCYACNRIRV
jgi:hypothetical protein